MPFAGKIPCTATALLLCVQGSALTSSAEAHQPDSTTAVALMCKLSLINPQPQRVVIELAGAVGHAVQLCMTIGRARPMPAGSQHFASELLGSQISDTCVDH